MDHPLRLCLIFNPDQNRGQLHVRSTAEQTEQDVPNGLFDSDFLFGKLNTLELSFG